MLLTENYLRELLCSRREKLVEEANFLACDGELNQECVEEEEKEINMIERVLNGKETITIADDSVVEYFKANSKLLIAQKV